jgi:hypothetical protein
MSLPAVGAIRRRVYPVMGHSRRSQWRRQARSGPVQRWHLAGHAPVQHGPAARYQRNHGNRFGECGFATPHQVRCWPGELCDYQRSSRNSNRHEWIDGACNHNDSARPSGCALAHADRHRLLKGSLPWPGESMVSVGDDRERYAAVGKGSYPFTAIGSTARSRPGKWYNHNLYCQL